MKPPPLYFNHESLIGNRTWQPLFPAGQSDYTQLLCAGAVGRERKRPFASNQHKANCASRMLLPRPRGWEMAPARWAKAKARKGGVKRWRAVVMTQYGGRELTSQAVTGFSCPLFSRVVSADNNHPRHGVSGSLRALFAFVPGAKLSAAVDALGAAGPHDRGLPRQGTGDGARVLHEQQAQPPQRVRARAGLGLTGRVIDRPGKKAAARLQGATVS